RLQVNDFASLYSLTLAGAGIAPLPMLIAAPAVRAGNLIPVLPDWPFEASPIHALYPSNRHLSAKVRSFVDFVIESIRPNPPWEVLDSANPAASPSADAVPAAGAAAAYGCGRPALRCFCGHGFSPRAAQYTAGRQYPGSPSPGQFCAALPVRVH